MGSYTPEGPSAIGAPVARSARRDGSSRGSGSAPPKRRKRTSSPSFRIRRILTLAALITLVPAVISFAISMAGTGNSSFSIRSVEWLRSNGGAGLVSKVENIYYSLTAPSKGGAPLKKLPSVGVGGGEGASSGGSQPHHPYRPPRIAPLASPALPGEGVWRATRSGEGLYPPVLVSTFRSDPSEYPQLVAGVAWIDPRRTRIVLYPGTGEPSVEIPQRGPSEVPTSLRSKLLATFNAGFKYEDSHGGFALNGHAYAPMENGQGTIVRYASGKMNVLEWHGGPEVPANVAFATQNLPLIVENGRPNPKLNDSAEWGATLGNAVQVWRSGVGIDRHGDLIYAQANYQTVGSLANILIHAGAVRALELDINSYWVSFNTYLHPGALDPTKLLPETERPAERYLTPDERDFFAVYEK